MTTGQDRLVWTPWEPRTHVVDNVTHSLERTVVTTPGYDCRDGCSDSCPHKRKGRDYGWNGDEHRCVMCYKRGAIQFAVHTSLFEGKPVAGPRRVRAAHISFCWGFRIDEEDVRNPDTGEDCMYLGTRCYGNGDTSFLQASEMQGLIASVGDDVGFAARAKQLLSCDGLWDELARRLVRRYEGVAADHRELPQRCATCNGAGVVSVAPTLAAVDEQFSAAWTDATHLPDSPQKEELCSRMKCVADLLDAMRGP